MESNRMPPESTQRDFHPPPRSQRIFPPSQAIERENIIDVSSEKLKNLLSIQLDPTHANFNDHLIYFMQLMEKIRLAVQSNLGLSTIARETHESYQPIWIKKGKFKFPIEENGKINDKNILFDTTKLKSYVHKNSPKVCIIADHSNDEGFSILYKTKYRHFSLYIQSNGKVSSSLTLNWKEIYDNLCPDNEDLEEPFRSFTPWQRHSESNFFNGRSTDKILNYLTNAYPDIFKHDQKSYYKDKHSEKYDLTQKCLNQLNTNQSNLYVVLDDSIITPPKDGNSTTQPILAVIRRKSPLLGNVFQLAPGIYRNRKLHLVLHGHQEETEIQTIFSCDFESQKLNFWVWQSKTVIFHSNSNFVSKPLWKNLHLLKYGKQHDLIKRTSIAPMVRASDVAMRKFWVGSLDIPNSYSEMITIADIFCKNQNERLNPQEILENFYYSDRAASSFRRLNISEYELEKTDHFAFQIVLPHDTIDNKFFWGENGEYIARTVGIAYQVLLSMVPIKFHCKMRFAVNMCCPAASIETMGAGFGLRNHPNYIENIIKAVKAIDPTIAIEFKSLMLSNADNLINRPENKAILENQLQNISFNKNKTLCEMLHTFGANRLIWQSKPRNEETYDCKTSLNISNSANVSHTFKFSYSGMVATLSDSDLLKLGYLQIGKPHYSVESVIEYINKEFEDKLSSQFEVMLGRILLGSSWLLLGYYASDQEIILLTLLQSLLLREFSTGAGSCGIDLMQIQLLYNIRHISNEELRNQLMLDILQTRNSDKMIDLIHEKYNTITKKNDRDETSMLQPSQLKLKSAISYASANRYSLFSERETLITQHLQQKTTIMKTFKLK